MALRIKAHWHDDEAERSIDEIASALSFNAWRIAKEKAINLHGEDFVYETDEQRFAVMAEYLIFQLAIIDRICSDRLQIDDEIRKKLVVNTARGMAMHLQDNMADVFGQGDYIQAFIATMNRRGAEYAQFNFSNEGPSYPFMRHLGFEIQQLMGDSQENRWVIDQVMDSDGVDVYKKLSRASMDLFG